MKERSYFITWSKQKEALTFTLLGAQGVEFRTKEYGTLVDLSSTSYQVSFGNSNTTIIDSINSQLQDFPTAAPKSDFDLKENIGRQLLELMDLEGGKFFYTVSGAESIENALKMARQVTGKKTIAALSNSYHGATLGALSVTGDWRHYEHLTFDEYTLRLPSPQEDQDGSQARQKIIDYGPENIAGICLETITGGNGVYFATQNWWNEIQSLCREFDIKLILDEVICGFYRTGKAFGFHHYDIEADFICLSKSITGGYIPFGALWVHPNIAKIFDHKVFSYGLTHYAHPLGLAATSGVLKLLKSNEWQKNYQGLLLSFDQQLSKIKALNCVKEVRSIGLLAAIELHQEVDQKELFENGLYIMVNKKNLILAPPTTMGPECLEQSLTKLGDVLQK